MTGYSMTHQPAPFEITEAGIPPLDYMPAEGWRERAKCRGSEVTMWFPYKGEGVNELKRVCASCPVRLDCLVTALDDIEKYGVFGGYGEGTRKKMRMKWTRRACRYCHKPQPYEPTAGGQPPTCDECAAARRFQLLEEGRQNQLRQRLGRQMEASA